MLRLVAIGVLAAACGRSAETCKEEANALGALLQQAITSPRWFEIADDLHLVVRNDLPAREPSEAPTVTLRPRAIVYQETQLATADELSERLAAVHAKIEEDIALGRFPRRHVPDPRRVYFLIDEATPWSEVVAAVGAATRAGMTAPSFAFAEPVTVTPPPRAAIDPKIDEIEHGPDGGNKATAIADLISTEIQGCSSMVRLFGEVGAEEDEPPAQLLVRRIGPALIACGCQVNMPNVRSVFWRLLSNPHPVRLLAVNPDAPATSVKAPATATWKEVGGKLAPDLANAEFSVE